MTCQFPACKSERIYQNSLCYDHWRFCDGKPPIKEIKTIPKTSDKRKELEKEYLKLKKQMMAESNKCEAKLSGCTKVAVDMHHMKGRGKNLTANRENLIRVCRSCHQLITENSLLAFELGLSKSKHKIA